MLLCGCGLFRDDKIQITTNSEEARAFFLQGRELAEHFHVQEARPFFEKAIAADPDFALAYLYLATSQPSSEDFMETFNKAKQLSDRSSGNSSDGSGWTLIRLTAGTQASENVNRAKKLVNKVSRGERLWILAADAGIRGDLVQKENYLRELVRSYPKDELALFLLGNYYFFEQRKFAEAIEAYNKAIEINPEYATVNNMLGYSHARLQNYPEAEEAFKQYIAQRPDDSNPYDSYAEMLMKIGKHDESIEYYRKALSIDSGFINSYTGIAANLNLLNRHAEARSMLNDMLDDSLMKHQRQALLWALCISYVDEDSLDRAIAVLEERCALAKTNNESYSLAFTYNEIGNLYAEMNRLDEAKSLYKRAIAEFDSSNLPEETIQLQRDVYLLRSCYIALKEHDTETARALIQDYIRRPRVKNIELLQKYVHQFYGMIDLEEKDYIRAIDELQQSDLEDPYNLYRLATAYEGHGHYTKAEELYEQAAHYNTLNSLRFALIRKKAEQALSRLHSLSLNSDEESQHRGGLLLRSDPQPMLHTLPR